MNPLHVFILPSVSIITNKADCTQRSDYEQRHCQGKGLKQTTHGTLSQSRLTSTFGIKKIQLQQAG